MTMADTLANDQEYPWYATVDSTYPLEQGDFIVNCPIVIPPRSITAEDAANAQPLGVKVRVFNVVVMSQSCDLVQDKLDYVLVCPYADLNAVSENHVLYGKRNREKARQGNFPAYHVLNSCDIVGFDLDYSYVSFRDVYATNIELARQLIVERGKRLRLLPPYREHLAQAFARFFMRVGLPQDIPAFR